MKVNENRRLIKNTGIIAIGNISTKLVSFLLLPLYTSLLSTSEYGEFDYILSIAMFCVPFVSVLMDESIFRFLIDCDTEEEQKKVISAAIMVVLIAMLFFLVMGIPIMNQVGYKYTYYAALYVALNTLCGMLSALLRGIGKTDQFALFNFLLGIIQIILNVFFIAFLRWGLRGMLLATIIAQLVVLSIFILKVKLWRKIDLKKVSIQLVKEMIIYSFPLIPNKISWTIINLSDRIILMNVLGSNSAGLYAVSYKFPNLMDTVYGFFYQSWKESSARVLGDESQDVFYNSVYGYLKDFLYSLVLGMSAIMPLVFHYFINEDYHSAIFYVPILLLATYFSNISGFYGGIFTAYKNTKIMGITTVAAAVINLVLNVCLIRKFGIYAAAISTLLANFFVYLYRKIRVKRYLVLYENMKKTIFSIIVTLFVFSMFYIQNIICNVLSCIVATIYFAFTNRKMLYIIIMKIRKSYIELHYKKVE